MFYASRVSSIGWKVLLFFCFCFVVWSGLLRIQKIERVSSLGPQKIIPDPSSVTGYAGGRRWQIVPEHNLRSFHWIQDTQQMLATGELRIRHVQYDNAPFGRISYSPSPYRWWLGAVAWCDHLIYGHSFGLSVERAVLVADPLLQIFLLILGTVLVARWFGPTAAVLFAVGLVSLFPLASAFLPGAPDSRALFLITSLWSIMPLVRSASGVSSSAGQSNRKEELGFIFGGIIGGVGLWLDLTGQGTLVLGLALGGVLQGLMERENRVANAIPDRKWLLWGLSGATTSLLGYILEYAPGHLDWRPEVNHPVYALAWLGLGIFVAHFRTRGVRSLRPSTWQGAAVILFAILSCAALPFSLWFTNRFPSIDPLTSILANLPEGVTANNFGQWISRDGLNADLLLTCSPLLSVISISVIGWRICSEKQRSALALGLGPLLATATLAWFHLQEWTLVDLTVLVVAIVVVTISPGRQKSAYLLRIVGVSSATIIVVGGLFRLAPPKGGQGHDDLSRLEIVSLIERDVANWIADRSERENSVFLAPPYCSVGLAYFGGLRGLGSPSWENREGMSAMLQIMGSTRSDEALPRLEQREVTHLVLPSWDQDLDELLKWTTTSPTNTLLATIRSWSIPPWLKPVAYSPPTMAGFENQTVLLLRVTDETDSSTALISRAEYFLESHQLDWAAATSEALKAFPAKVGALAARSQIAKASGDNAEFASVFEKLVSQFEANPRLPLRWNERVSLSAVFALGGKPQYARGQLQICLDEITDQKLRNLNTTALYHLMVLMKAYGLNFPSPKLREQALYLLPEELGQRFK